MKKIALFLVSLYLNLLFSFGYIGLIVVDLSKKNIISDLLKNGYYITWLSIVILLLILSIINLISAIKLFIQKDVILLRKSMILIKLASIPFFIFNFIFFVVVLFVFVVASRGLGIILVPIPIIITYLILLVTSTYSILFIIILKRFKIISNKSAIINIIIQLIFVLDMIGVLFLLKNYSKKYCIEIKNNINK